MTDTLDTRFIVKQFENYIPLSCKDKELVSSLVKPPVTYLKNTSVWHQGTSSERFYILSKGWVYAYRNMEDGTRQVLDLYVPGDIIGLREFAFRKRGSGLMTLSNAELYPFSMPQLSTLFAHSPSLCNVLFTIVARHQAILLERMVNLGRRSAREKLAHFLVELSERLRRVQRIPGNALELPVPQALLADALGLSVVHVNRTCRELKENGLVMPAGSGLTILDLEGLRKVAQFDAYYLEHDAETLSAYLRTSAEANVSPDC
ncbi:Crp/Fnr family transcriptional regulator [Marinobacter fonticola]|uniref:Crp/Fnr family transcriptional regulator n=1 Tax=Marinobacter fonticola TaxID=2603215 RepID=UPI0011E85F60|nr:Crp/Fnr family transcriptional regulator [Marinobacter fonticola]